MTHSMEELISQIKDRLDIVDVVSKQVVLKKSGHHYWGLCPFHKEKTPSFSVNPQLGIYKCFGCGAGGDALSFIMKTQNVEFMDLIRDLAEEFGLEMPKKLQRNDGLKDIKEQMIQASAKATEFYSNQLLKTSDSENALNYLAKRGISKDVIKKFHLGFAPKSYSSLYDHLKKDFPKIVTVENLCKCILTYEYEISIGGEKKTNKGQFQFSGHSEDFSYLYSKLLCGKDRAVQYEYQK